MRTMRTSEFFAKKTSVYIHLVHGGKNATVFINVPFPTSYWTITCNDVWHKRPWCNSHKITSTVPSSERVHTVLRRKPTRDSPAAEQRHFPKNLIPSGSAERWTTVGEGKRGPKLDKKELRAGWIPRPTPKLARWEDSSGKRANTCLCGTSNATFASLLAEPRRSGRTDGRTDGRTALHKLVWLAEHTSARVCVYVPGLPGNRRREGKTSQSSTCNSSPLPYFGGKSGRSDSSELRLRLAWIVGAR